jgi:hypothetical protein
MDVPVVPPIDLSSLGQLSQLRPARRRRLLGSSPRLSLLGVVRLVATFFGTGAAAWRVALPLAWFFRRRRMRELGSRAVLAGAAGTLGLGFARWQIRRRRMARVRMLEARAIQLGDYE